MNEVDAKAGGQGNLQDGRQSLGPMGPGMMGLPGYGPMNSLNNMMGDPSMMMMGPMGFGQVDPKIKLYTYIRLLSCLVSSVIFLNSAMIHAGPIF